MIFYFCIQLTIFQCCHRNCCFCLEEGLYFEEDNKIFQRCRCCGHFPPVVAWSCLLAELLNQKSGGSVSCDLWYRRKVASFCVFFKIDSLVGHLVSGLFLAQYVLRRPTRGALAAHSRSFEMSRFRTGQFSRSFVLSCVRFGNWLRESVVAGEVLGAFKISVNRFLLQDWQPGVSSCSSTVSLSFSRDLRAL